MPVLIGAAGVSLSHSIAQTGATQRFPGRNAAITLTGQTPFVTKQHALQQWLRRQGRLPGHGHGLIFATALYVIARPRQAVYTALLFQQAVGTLYRGQRHPQPPGQLTQ